MSEGVYNYVDYYTRAAGKGKEGLYFYNFGLSTNPYSNQPSGAINLARFNKVEFQTNNEKLHTIKSYFRKTIQTFISIRKASEL